MQYYVMFQENKGLQGGDLLQHTALRMDWVLLQK